MWLVNKINQGWNINQIKQLIAPLMSLFVCRWHSHPALQQALIILIIILQNNSSLFVTNDSSGLIHHTKVFLFLELKASCFVLEKDAIDCLQVCIMCLQASICVYIWSFIQESFTKSSQQLESRCMCTKATLSERFFCINTEALQSSSCFGSLRFKQMRLFHKNNID